MKKIFASILVGALCALVFAAEVFTSPAGYGPEWKVVVSIEEQKSYVYKKNVLVREMLCSTGLLDGNNDTPLGNFVLNKSGQKRGAIFFSRKYGYGAKWWVAFKEGAWLFHSLPTDKNGNVIPEEAEKLGQPASNGNIWLSMEDAKWFYETVPDGAKIKIQKKKHSKE